jgi:hypothetical protein
MKQQQERQFVITWEVDEWAASAKEAATKVWNRYFQSTPDRTANVFTVHEKDEPDNKATTIDLNEEINAGAIKQEMGRILSEDEEYFDVIIEALRKALVNDPDGFIDDVEFDRDGEIDTINVWEKVQNKFLVKDFCEMVGIEDTHYPTNDHLDSERRTFSAMQGGTD